MRKLSSILFTAAAALVGAISVAGVATAADLTATFQNSTSEDQFLTSSSGPWSGPPSFIAAFDSDSDNATSSGNLVATARYTDQYNRGCYFQATASLSAGRYTFNRSATPFGIYNGVQARCAATITSSNSTTGEFNVSFTLSGY